MRKVDTFRLTDSSIFDEAKKNAGIWSSKRITSQQANDICYFFGLRTVPGDCYLHIGTHLTQYAKSYFSSTNPDLVWVLGGVNRRNHPDEIYRQFTDAKIAVNSRYAKIQNTKATYVQCVAVSFFYSWLGFNFGEEFAERFSELVKAGNCHTIDTASTLLLTLEQKSAK